MQKMTIMPIMVFTFIFVTALVSLQASYAQSVNYTTFTNNDLGISFEYPSDWTIKEKESRFDQGADVEVEGILQKFIVSKFESSFNEEGLDMVGGLKGMLEQFFTAEDRKIGEVEENKYTIDGEDTASVLTASGLSAPNSESASLEIGKEYIAVSHNGIIYFLVYSNTTDNFDAPKSQEVFNHIINSFKFLDSNDAGSEDNDAGSEDNDA